MDRLTKHYALTRQVFTIAVTGLTLIMSSAVYADNLATLQQIIEKTVTSNPEVQARYHNFTAAQKEELVTKGNLLPQLDLTANYRKQENIGPNVANVAIPEYQSALELRQLLFDGFATSNEINRLSHATRVRYYELQAAMQGAALEAVSTYLDIQRFRQLKEHAQDNYVAHKQFYDRIQERVAAGVGRRVDLEQANGRLALAEANLLTEVTNLHDVMARYQRLVGELPPDNLPEIDLAERGLPPSIKEALEVAYRQNPDLLGAIENIVATEQEVKSKRGSYMPRLDMNARKVLDVSSNGRNSIQAADVFEVTMRFNLFNGFSDRAAVDQSAQKLISTQDMRDKACVDVRQTVVIAYNDIYRLREQLVYRDQHQLAIEKAREAYRNQFDIGQRTLLDLLDTENEYFQARRTYANSLYDMRAAQARTFAGQGELLNKLTVARKDLPDYGRPEYMDRQNVCEAVAPTMLQVDKQALLASAKPLSDTLISLKTGSGAAPEPVPAKVLSKKVIPDVQFETNSAKIIPSTLPALDNAIKELKEWGDAKVEIGGHTDKRNTSSASYNQKLSEARARAVRDYLISKGEPADRFTVVGYGFEQPIAENDPIAGNDENRRVELVRME